MENSKNHIDYKNEIDNLIGDTSSPDVIMQKFNQYAKSKNMIWLHHNDQKILFIDASNVKPDDLIKHLYFITKYMLSLKSDYIIRILYNLTNVKFGTDAVLALKEFKKSYIHLKGKSAIIGLSPIQKIFVKTTGRDTFVANDKDTALDWLADNQNIHYFDPVKNKHE